MKNAKLKRNKVVIWGAGGHALVVAEILRHVDEWVIVGFIDDVAPNRQGESFCGARVLGGSRELGSLREDGVTHLALAVGDNTARLRMMKIAEARHFALATAVHPSTVVSADAVLGAGTIVAAGAVINPGARVGRGVIINTASIVEHECVIGDGAYICSGVILAGRVEVGRGARIGIGAVVTERLVIGEGSSIGAGSVVVRNIPGGVMACGVPARIVKSFNE